MGGQEKEWMGCFLNYLRAFGINADQWTTAAQDEGEWRRTAEQGAERFMVVVCCCFSHSAHWLPTRKKLLYTVANPARGLLNRDKKEKSESLAAPPRLLRALPVRRKKTKKTRDASTCPGATQVGVTPVVLVCLASVQGFLRLVS